MFLSIGLVYGIMAYVLASRLVFPAVKRTVDGVVPAGAMSAMSARARRLSLAVKNTVGIYGTVTRVLANYGRHKTVEDLVFADSVKDITEKIKRIRIPAGKELRCFYPSVLDVCDARGAQSVEVHGVDEMGNKWRDLYSADYGIAMTLPLAPPPRVPGPIILSAYIYSEGEKVADVTEVLRMWCTSSCGIRRISHVLDYVIRDALDRDDALYTRFLLNPPDEVPVKPVLLVTRSDMSKVEVDLAHVTYQSDDEEDEEEEEGAAADEGDAATAASDPTITSDGRSAHSI